MTEDEEFFAWLDGELPSEQAAAVEARVAARPDLSQRAAEHRGLAGGLRGAFDPVLESDVAPPRFASAEVVEIGARATEGRMRRPQFGVPQWAAMAATLALGLLVGNFASRGTEDTLVKVDNGRLVAAASLDQALDARLASKPTNDGARIGLTFRDRSGKICRSFSDLPANGLACRDGGQWRVQGLFRRDGPSGDYRMAAGQDPRLAEMIDQTIAGEPFDAAQERAALEQGWR